ncbi:MAG: hypothetical protein IIW39_00935 [Clostridia bacterium]|nr:hypothetical protein [Clostridia bacterium]MBQ5837213.1 hypothetical protein [Clostridia bacterium]
MRRAIIFLILLALMCGIAFFIYSAYTNHESIADFTNIHSNSRVLAGDTFSGKFRYDSESLKIKGYEYEVIEDDLYITIYVGTAGDFAETDEDGYITVEISGLPEIDKVYYDDGDNTTVMPTVRE